MAVQPILIAALTPYLCVSLYDGYLHDRARRVPFPEQVAHGLLGLSMALFLFGVFRQHSDLAAISLSIYVGVYAIDEFVFHPGIARHERLVHAVAMVALSVFVVCWRLVGQ